MALPLCIVTWPADDSRTSTMRAARKVGDQIHDNMYISIRARDVTRRTDGCEECLKTAMIGFISERLTCGRSGAAIHQETSTPPNTILRLTIRSYNLLSGAKIGRGATSIRLCLSPRISPVGPFQGLVDEPFWSCSTFWSCSICGRAASNVRRRL
jgi:hypothetical protein